jgi:hypothetical protein
VSGLPKRWATVTIKDVFPTYREENHRRMCQEQYWSANENWGQEAFAGIHLRAYSKREEDHKLEQLPAELNRDDAMALAALASCPCPPKGLLQAPRFAG